MYDCSIVPPPTPDFLFIYFFYLLWEQLWAARRPVVASHYRCLAAPADGDVAQLLVSGGLTRWARHKAAASPPGCCRFAGPDPTVSLHKTNANIRTCGVYGSVRNDNNEPMMYSVSCVLICFWDVYFTICCLYFHIWMDYLYVLLYMKLFILFFAVHLDQDSLAEDILHLIDTFLFK